MHLDVVPRKTDLARDMIQRRHTLPRSQRMFLIMIDGRKSLRDLSEAASQLGIDNAALASLANAGLIQWSRDDSAPERAPVGIMPASGLANATSTAQRSVPLVAIKLYAMDLLALLLAGQDHALRDAARQVGDADSLRVWLVRCADEIARLNNSDRAELFRVRVESQLPPDFLAQVAA